MMENDNKDQKSFWKTFKKLGNSKNCEEKYVSPEKFYNYFRSTFNSKRQLNMPANNHQIGKLDYEFTEEELIKGTKTLKNGKATGMDNLSNEMIKGFVDIYPQLVTKLFNGILKTSEIIPEWTVGMITPIFKKGSKSDPNNYRGISLLSCFGKFFYYPFT